MEDKVNHGEEKLLVQEEEYLRSLGMQTPLKGMPLEVQGDDNDVQGDDVSKEDPIDSNTSKMKGGFDLVLENPHFQKDWLDTFDFDCMPLDTGSTSFDVSKSTSYMETEFDKEVDSLFEDLCPGFFIQKNID